MPSPTFTLRLPTDQRAALDVLSEKSGIPVAEIVKACITRALPYVRERIDSQLVRVNDQP